MHCLDSCEVVFSAANLRALMYFIWEKNEKKNEKTTALYEYMYICICLKSVSKVYILQNLCFKMFVYEWLVRLQEKT